MNQEKILPFNPNQTVEYIHLKKQIATTVDKTLKSNPHLHPFFTTTRLKRIDFDNETYKLETRQQYLFLGESTWQTYSKFYRHLISNLTNNFRKKPHLHPLTYDFLDVDGTGDNPRATFSRTTIPHIHSIYLIHEDTLERWQRLMSQQFIEVVAHPSVLKFVSRFHAKPIYDLPGAVAYASKFYDIEQARRIRREYQFYSQQPISIEEKKSLKDQRESLPFHMQVTSRREMKARFAAFGNEKC